MAMNRFVQLLALLALLFVPASAWANIGPRWWGNLSTEPKGLKGARITREDLTIDLRPLANVQPVEVSVIYHLYNSGPARKLDLLFVSGAVGVDDFEVRLDGRLMPSQRLPSEEVRRHWEDFPDGWRPKAIGVGEGDVHWGPVGFHHEPEEVVLMAFSIELPTGPSTLTARYWARACGIYERSPMVTWAFPYVLSPAKDWDGFGRLHVVVHVPEGWESASRPELERDGSALRGTFVGLPADALVVAVRAPEGWARYRAMGLFWGAHAFALVAGGAICWLAGRCEGRFLARRWPSRSTVRNQLEHRTLAVGVVMALLWAAAIFGSWWLGEWAAVAAFRGQENPYFQRSLSGMSCVTFFLMLIALPAGFCLARWSARRSFERADLQSRPATN
jgi:hypothetical protein